MIHRRVVAGAAIVAALVAVACDRPADGTSHVRAVPAAVLARVPLGSATPADVERLLGAPDARDPDGAMVYHAQVTKGPGHGRAETITFRFQGGVLSKVCRRETGAT